MRSHPRNTRRNNRKNLKAGAPVGAPRRALDRRGVISVLAMMFMVLFGSLAAAMAIVSKGNLRTAQTHLRVSGSLSAVDAGMSLAAGRLSQAAGRLLVWKGEITADYAEELWLGTYTDADGPVLNEMGEPTTAGLRDILASLHPGAGDPGTVSIDPELTPQSDWLVTAPIVLETVSDQVASAFQVTYIPTPLPEEDRLGVRAMITGFSWDFVTNQWTRRSAQRLFRIDKRPRQAVLGQSKIMIGKNVQINGPIGARFTGVENIGGHPLVLRSDFYGLNPILDEKLDDFYAAVLTTDVDGDNRLRTLHAVERSMLSTLAATSYDNGSGGQQAGVVGDFTNDGVVDEYDIFLKHYDANGDGKVALSDALRAGTPNESLTAEFADIDEDLAILIDAAIPDRNRDGLVDGLDVALGFRDGVLDLRDRYAKVRGAALFRTQVEPWEQQLDSFGQPIGDYQQFVQGAIVPAEGDPVVFGAGDDELPPINLDTFNVAQSALGMAADGAPLASQAGLSWIWTPTLNSDGVVVGQTLNPVFDGDDSDGFTIVREAVPLTSIAPIDFYDRPVFIDKVFRNVVIPKGTNALFVNCTFVGVTRIETHIDNTHVAWQFYGMQNADGALAFPPLPAESDAQLDNDYFPPDGSIIPPPGFDVERLNVSGTPYVTTKPLSNNIRFQNCTIVGSIVADKPTNFTNIRNKLQFTGATVFATEHPIQPENSLLNPDPEDLPAIRKSSLMAPHYSVDIGENNADPAQDVQLNGLIIAGVLDVRGNTGINGALLISFAPTADDPALMHFGEPVGNPADFNITLGYFGIDDGDEEGLAPFEFNGDQIVGFDTDDDGRADTLNPADGGTPVLFNGFGRIVINFDPTLVLPDGLIAPLLLDPIGLTYHEGRTLVEGAP